MDVWLVSYEFISQFQVQLDLIQMAVVYSVVLHGHLSMCMLFLQFTFSVAKQK